MLFIVLFIFINFNPINFKKDDQDKIMCSIIKKINKNNDCCILLYPSNIIYSFLYHYDINIFKRSAQLNKQIEANNIYAINNLNNFFDKIICEKIILFDSNSKFIYPNNNLIEELKKNYDLKFKRDFLNNKKIVFYEKLKINKDFVP